MLRLITFDGQRLSDVATSKFDGPTVAGARFSPDGARFISYMAQSVGPAAPTKRHPIESVTDERVWLNGLTGPVLAAQWSPDGEKVFTGANDGVISIWSAKTGEKRAELSGHKGPVAGLAVMPGGEALFSVGIDGTLRRWNLTTNTATWVTQAHETAIRHVFITSDGLLVTGGQDTVIRVWSAAVKGGGDTLDTLSKTSARGTDNCY